MHAQTDSELIARICKGDVPAFEEIVRRHRAALVALAASRLGSLTDAEDVAQEAFVQAFFRIHQLRQPESLLAWLRRLAERFALMRLRHRHEEAWAPEQVEEVRNGCAASDQPHTDGGLAHVLGKLPETMRRTVTLTYLGGYTCAETAGLLGVQEGTVKSRLSRARALLKETYGMTKETLKQARPKGDFTKRTIEDLMREARRLVERGDFDGAAARAQKVLHAEAEAYASHKKKVTSASGGRERGMKGFFIAADDPAFNFSEEAVRIAGLPLKERRRRDCEANAAQYGYRLEDLDWELGDVDIMSNTLGRPAGHGKDWWGVPHHLDLSIVDARDTCRRFRCSPQTLLAWVEQGCPILRCWPFARFDLDRVRQWLADRKIADWPKESDHDLERPIRVIFKALHQREITPKLAEQIITDLAAVSRKSVFVRRCLPAGGGNAD